ncbi:glycoside hydrolase family 9 protein [Marinilabiliaceae bacterium ANBcel2]|nr:glycoside hydrolase family 9 protein [Marinilabiliaceae bacterium ANBcel2]
MKKNYLILFLICLTIYSKQPHLNAINSLQNQEQHNYEKALHLSTRFLGAQRSGDTKSWILPEGSGGAFLNDGEAVGKDLSGGWHDCGDYIKFHVTGSYAALLYLYGFDKWPKAYPDNYSQAYSKAPANGIPDVLDEVKIQTDFLIKCIGDEKIYWQIGDNRDHNGFKEPITQSSLKLYDDSAIRPVYEATEGKSNALGAGSAALALMSILYEPYDTEYAKECLAAAKKYYQIASTNPSTTADATDDSYSWLTQWSDYYDELGTAAIMLYRATKDKAYLNEAISLAENADQYRNFSYGHIDQLLFYELYQITKEVKYLNKIESKVNSLLSDMEPCGYVHLTDWGSLRDAGNAALLAALLHNETGNIDAYNFAKSNIDFILGSHNGIDNDAPANFSFLIGYDELGGGYPKYPHHAAAFGKKENGWTHFSNERDNPGSVPYAYELSGGLAGGPEDACCCFEDNIANYVSSEYCIYYNAAFNSALAYIHIVEESSTSIDSNEKFINVQNIKAFPNPADNYLNITLDGTANLALTDINGNTIWQSEVFRYYKLPVNSFKKGIYILYDKNSNWSKKISIR